MRNTNGRPISCQLPCIRFAYKTFWVNPDSENLGDLDSFTFVFMVLPIWEKDGVWVDPDSEKILGVLDSFTVVFMVLPIWRGST
ncbi:hypothetical protein CEXT_621071 [Caerostris extrusa]|uniref:Uncharacterized protein n=1 Tax=Caerostris extrusa TaxID=172846 RepID=A0AAV4TQZ4_CAEEX|nr:hypothetical protein CEXT_621071 [Caerostris extrusa]